MLNRMCIVPSFPLIISVVLTVLLQSPSTSVAQVLPLTIPMCRDLGYNFIALPNNFNEFSQDRIAEKLAPYANLTKSGPCGVEFKRFVCSLYAPMCTTSSCTDIVQYPCNNLCHVARAQCEPYLINSEGKTWPAEMDCAEVRWEHYCLEPSNDFVVPLPQAEPEIEDEQSEESLRTEDAKKPEAHKQNNKRAKENNRQRTNENAAEQKPAEWAKPHIQILKRLNNVLQREVLGVEEFSDTIRRRDFIDENRVRDNLGNKRMATLGKLDAIRDLLYELENLFLQ